MAVSAAIRATLSHSPNSALTSPFALWLSLRNSRIIRDVGTYNGVASLLDEHDAKLVDVRLTLATADDAGLRWFGSTNDQAVIDLNGHEVTIELPAGTRGRAMVDIDLSGDEPRIRLVGSGPAPV